MKVLIVEDDTYKYGRMRQELSRHNVLDGDIKHVVTTSQAMDVLQQRQFDLMLLDVNLPRRFGEGSKRGEGLSLLRELSRDSKCWKPDYVVGVTAYEDVVAEFGEEFDQHLWSLVLYSENSDRWMAQLGFKLEYIRALQKSKNFSDGRTYGADLAIVTALDTNEIAAVKALPYGWQRLRVPSDDTRFFVGNIDCDSRSYSVVAAAAHRMGMPASAVLSTKLIHLFRPRMIAMVGICAGRAGKVRIGDVIVADPMWDWGSGKIVSDQKVPKFLPAPHQLDLDTDLLSCLKDLAEDKSRLLRIRERAYGKKPPFELNVHFGPLISGSAVVAHRPTFDHLLDQHRGILGIDMEAYSVAMAALSSGKPKPLAVVLKAVCDYADEQKDDDYQDYAASVSAQFLHEAAPQLLEIVSGNS